MDPKPTGNLDELRIKEAIAKLEEYVGLSFSRLASVPTLLELDLRSESIHPSLREPHSSIKYFRTLDDNKVVDGKAIIKVGIDGKYFVQFFDLNGYSRPPRYFYLTELKEFI